MRKAKIFFNKIVLAGRLIEKEKLKSYVFEYDLNYIGPPISLTMPIKQKIYVFNNFPIFFENLLPEGLQLESLLNKTKLNNNDYFGQLLTVGKDLVGAFSAIEE